MTFTRYELTIPVELTSELQIGGVDPVPDRDGEGTVIRFNRNGLKEPTIPGRSIRGAVRAACDVARQALDDAGARRLVEAVAAETDDGSLSVAVGDSVDTADVELRRQGDGNGELIACECHLSSPPLGVSSHTKCLSFAFVTSMDRMLRRG